MILFENPLSATKVRNGIFAYRYRNGLILIDGQKFYGYTIKQAIQLYRNKNK